MKIPAALMPTQEQADQILGYLLWRASKMWQRRMVNSLKALDIGSTQFVVLGNAARLSADSTAVSQRALAGAAAMDVMTVSQTVRGLVAKGLLQYAPRTVDRRERSVLPTPAGVDLLQEALDKVSAAHAQFFQLTESDQADLAGLLNRLIKENANEKHIA